MTLQPWFQASYHFTAWARRVELTIENAYSDQQIQMRVSPNPMKRIRLSKSVPRVGRARKSSLQGLAAGCGAIIQGY